MKLKKTIIGWDIGGAHIKSCVLNGKTAQCRVNLCELWKDTSLEDHIHRINKKYHKTKSALNVITMSGEMCDGFINRKQGVKNILSKFDKYPDSFVYTTQNGLVRLGKKRIDYSTIASANWHIIASYMKNKVKSSIVIDLGSTTTDYIIIKNNKIINQRHDDFSGLKYKELDYTGFLRTPCFAICDHIKIRNQKYQLIPENFSALSDVYTILGLLPKQLNYSSTCDNRSKSLENSYRRLSRTFGIDYIKQNETFLLQASKTIAKLHYDKISKVIIYHVKKNHFINKNVKIIGAGVGEIVLREICKKNNISYISFSDFFNTDASSQHITPTHLAPAYILTRIMTEDYYAE